MKVEVQNLQFSYGAGDFRISIPELTVPTGQSLGIVGPSGCGKTTFLNIVSTVTRLRQGRLTLGDVNPAEMTDAKCREFRAKNIGYVYQDFGLIDYLSGRENLLYPFFVTGRRGDAALNSRIDQLTAEFGITHVLGRKPQNISQGERQRLAICRAILGMPSLILADEPTGNLDPANKSSILDHLCRQCQTTGATLIVVTHDRNLTDRFDQVIDFSDFAQVTR
ncbi:ATP-binding cassette domain-containing protein [uncultured Shimia sp.]|uniref:ABC transporter ATP-binding protein n=1 Tax=uncultured Shimia sp. TaxID=573152 RepID=UPI00263649AA|nr:ATP-binding cassette domain-containing protein [uncultured Shimia sp.]